MKVLFVMFAKQIRDTILHHFTPVNKNQILFFLLYGGAVLIPYYNNGNLYLALGLRSFIYQLRPLIVYR
jgi:hypothetical protein